MRCALIGNPSVGKSLIFNQLTGLGVEVSNYPGTTVELMQGKLCHQGSTLQVVDLPGIYSMDGDSAEEELVRTYLLAETPDAVIAVLDATRMERNLYLLLQLAEYGIPMVVVINMIDEAAQQGIIIDSRRLSSVLGAPVIETAASLGKNIGEIVPAVLSSARPAAIAVPYTPQIEAAIRSLGKLYGATRLQALHALQGIGTSSDLIEGARTIAGEIESLNHMSAHQIIGANRHLCAHRIAADVVGAQEPDRRFSADRLLTKAFPGIPILAVVLLSMLLTVFIAGSFLEELIVDIFTVLAIEPFQTLSLPPLATALGMAALLAIVAGLGIAFPFVLIFYLLLSIVEDTGYLTRAAFLADRLMHGLGLHGGAIIPMVMAFGCNVPAVMAASQLRTVRERTIAAFLVTMVPCSARTVIITGIVAAFVGLWAALSIYLIVLVLIVLTGVFLARNIPGGQYGMILEMAPLRMPDPVLVMKKSWGRIQEFLFIAMPLLLAGSVVLGALDYYGVVDAFSLIVAPVSEGFLGLPAYVTTALLFGILRKEMAFETLAVLSGTADLGSVLTGVQLYTFAVISVLFVPCISTIAVILRQMGMRVTLAVSAYTITLGFLIGGLIHFIAG
ncbi:ferrous iron transport protein B [Methanofollis liminatans DSM 4140]|uniref:Ferrous iron transport protein B n=1 Tax=Methanofollis liminatans DSM 4140 TaxID=28892 RepID=J1ANY0_9EURY|nr:ferrous iron transport protein B [Methanofollis liminatans]EJG06613.1 ferrous iron transport protein B [Methanofollis liminatans DSM 4140]